ncbi:MAG: Fur family transcriptional regulator [Chloroflexota bacterium]
MSCEQRFVQELHERGLRLTPQRELVLTALHVTRDHPSADEVFEHVHAHGSAVDRATVYRTLDLLQGLGLVYVCDLGDGVGRYELALHGPHAHLRCERCGHVSVLAGDDWVALARLLERFAFTPSREHLVIRGLCAACAQASGSQELAHSAATTKAATR